MNRRLFISAALMLATLYNHAQNTFPSSGNVGIGTTLPQRLLHVNGAGAFGSQVTNANATRVLNLADANAVMRILRVHPTNAPAIELLSRTAADGPNVAYWDMYAEPLDASFRIRDRVTGVNLDRFTIKGNGTVGIGTVSPNASSLLDLSSTTKGLLTPRMTTAQRNAIPSPAQGLLIFQTDGTRGFYYYDVTWKAVSASGGGSGANTTLSNLTSPTSVNQHLLPQTTKVYDLGSASLSWRNLHLRDDIYLDGTRFVSNAPGTASFNAFLGSHAGLSVSDGISNTAAGHDALRNTTTGSRNTAVGKQALFSNQFGDGNVALGNKALYTSVENGGNVAIGDSALANYDDFSEVDYMVAIGQNALASNTDGFYNTAVGGNSLLLNTSGASNTAVGVGALQNSTGGSNTAVGRLALVTSTTGIRNTALGRGADVSSGDLSNATAIGYDAKATASNQVMLGNTSVTSVMAAGSFVIYSDGRFKRDVKEEVPGLSFINKLRPVTYRYNIHGLNSHIRPHEDEKTAKEGSRTQRTEEGTLRRREEESIKAKEAMLYTGFVAQEVEQAAKELKYDFSGVHKPQSDKDAYGLSYSDFVVPLVKAVQELDQKTKRIEELESQVAELRQMVLDLKNGRSNTMNVSSAYMETAMPNPSRGTTTIRYGLPDGVGSARLILTNTKGQVLKSISLTGRGTGQVNLDAAALPSGVYTYGLLVEGTQVATKQLVIAH